MYLCNLGTSRACVYQTDQLIVIRIVNCEQRRVFFIVHFEKDAVRDILCSSTRLPHKIAAHRQYSAVFALKYKSTAQGCTTTVLFVVRRSPSLCQERLAIHAPEDNPSNLLQHFIRIRGLVGVNGHTTVQRGVANPARDTCTLRPHTSSQPRVTIISYSWTATHEISPSTAKAPPAAPRTTLLPTNILRTKHSPRPTEIARTGTSRSKAWTVPVSPQLRGVVLRTAGDTRVEHR